ncbi:glycosyltransferase family 4 protein [Plantibacter flavus]|uniref:glycosyltransferase family 4 protein n=1 Tax=Plantibacter flavus TaxID=150123 RepID=UPI003F145E9C
MTTTVLHVTECYAGGIPVAIEAYVRNSPPEVEHHLLVELPDGVTIDDEVFRPYRSVTQMGSGSAGVVAAIRRTRRRIGADVVHAHSSFAGAYARVALRNSPRTRIVYTPHCYAFERTDVPAIGRGVFRAIEWLLSFNVGTIAACSEGEAAAARRRGPLSPRVVYVPNVLSHAPDRARRRSAADDAPLRITSLGRLAPQKDPARFAAAASAIRERGVDVAPVWMGDGRAADVTLLEGHGVEVTGWIPHPEVAERLSESDVYLHTAAWEGFPLAVLEAVQSGVPTLVRRIDAFGELPDALTIEAGLEAMIFSRLAGAEVFAAWSEANLSLWARQLRNHTPEQQTEALADAYRVPVTV